MTPHEMVQFIGALKLTDSELRALHERHALRETLASQRIADATGWIIAMSRTESVEA